MAKRIIAYTNQNGKLCAIVADENGNTTIEETEHEAVEY
jgi:hypothetical protein